MTFMKLHINNGHAEKTVARGSGQSTCVRDRQRGLRIVIVSGSGTGSVEKRVIIVRRGGDIAYLDKHAGFEFGEIGSRVSGKGACVARPVICPENR